MYGGEFDVEAGGTLLGELDGTMILVGLEGVLVLKAPLFLCVVFAAGVDVCIVVGTEPVVAPQTLAKAAPEVRPRGGEGVKAEGGMAEDNVVQSQALSAESDLSHQHTEISSSLTEEGCIGIDGGKNQGKEDVLYPT
jgi:hypothetical protein